MMTADFVKRLRTVLRSNAAYAILDDGPTAGGTWQAGACWLLAKALREYLGCGSEAFVVHTPSRQAQHVALWLGGDDFLDADGMRTRRALVADVAGQMGGGASTLDLYVALGHRPGFSHEGIAKARGTPAQVRRLVDLLRVRLGPGAGVC